jgi:predicted amidophosphoribosyltransferase
MGVRSGFSALTDLVWPLTCGGCGATGQRWCPVCAADLAGSAGPTRPSPSPAGLPPTWAVAPYGEAVRQAIVAWKDEGRPDLTRQLARGLARSVIAALDVALDGALDGAATDRPATSGLVLLVPMPSRPRARRARGADPVRELALAAASAARQAGCTVRVAPALRHVRTVADQAGLAAADRAANLAGALEVRPDWRSRIAGTSCLLVDDVVTTGATLAEAAAAVRRARGHPFGAAVVAATQRTLGGHVTNFQKGD